MQSRLERKRSAAVLRREIRGKKGEILKLAQALSKPKSDAWDIGVQLRARSIELLTLQKGLNALSRVDELQVLKRAERTATAFKEVALCGKCSHTAHERPCVENVETAVPRKGTFIETCGCIG